VLGDVLGQLEGERGVVGPFARRPVAAVDHLQAMFDDLARDFRRRELDLRA